MVLACVAVGSTESFPLPGARSSDERGEHWIDRYEHEVEKHEEALRKRVMQPSGGPAENNGGHQ